MPRIDIDASSPGVGSTNERMAFRDRLMRRFAAHEWVRVINIDDETFFWQYLPVHAEKLEITDSATAPMKSTIRDSVEAYMLDPGESEVIIGENAFVMIEALYKKLISKKFLAEKGEAKLGDAGRNFNWSAGEKQEELIDRIYLGKETPSFSFEKAPDVPITKTEEPKTRLRRTL